MMTKNGMESGNYSRNVGKILRSRDIFMPDFSPSWWMAPCSGGFKINCDSVGFFMCIIYIFIGDIILFHC